MVRTSTLSRNVRFVNWKIYYVKWYHHLTFWVKWILVAKWRSGTWKQIESLCFHVANQWTTNLHINKLNANMWRCCTTVRMHCSCVSTKLIAICGTLFRLVMWYTTHHSYTQTYAPLINTNCRLTNCFICKWSLSSDDNTQIIHIFPFHQIHCVGF